MAHRNDDKYTALGGAGHIQDAYYASIGGPPGHINDLRYTDEYGLPPGHINDGALAFYGGQARPDGESAYWATP